MSTKPAQGPTKKELIAQGLDLGLTLSPRLTNLEMVKQIAEKLKKKAPEPAREGTEESEAGTQEASKPDRPSEAGTKEASKPDRPSEAALTAARLMLEEEELRQLAEIKAKAKDTLAAEDSKKEGNATQPPTLADIRKIITEFGKVTGQSLQLNSVHEVEEEEEEDPSRVAYGTYPSKDQLIRFSINADHSSPLKLHMLSFRMKHLGEYKQPRPSPELWQYVRELSTLHDELPWEYNNHYLLLKKHLAPVHKEFTSTGSVRCPPHASDALLHSIRLYYAHCAAHMYLDGYEGTNKKLGGMASIFYSCPEHLHEDVSYLQKKEGTDFISVLLQNAKKLMELKVTGSGSKRAREDHQPNDYTSKKKHNTPFNPPKRGSRGNQLKSKKKKKRHDDDSSDNLST